MIENITIELTGDEDKDFLAKNKEFLYKLNEQCNVFLKERDIAKKKWKTIPKKDFVPEQIKYSSPITIFNAPWGSGKTYFFEQLIYNKLTEKINFKNYKFKEIYLIDLWEYIDEQNIAISILLDIIDKLLPKEKIKEKAIKYFKKGTSFLLNWFLNVLTTPNIDLFNNEEKMNIGKIKNKLEKIDPTILIIDNLERMGDKSIEIIKIIQKLTYLNNLIIILPMDLDKLYLPVNIQEKLAFMEKYITLGKYFEFKQDYYYLLRNKGIKDVFSKDINIFIKKLNKKKYFSIRDLNNKINDKCIKEINNAYEYNELYGFWYFGNKVLKNNRCDNVVKEDIKNIINSIVEHIKEFISEYLEIDKEIKKLINSEKYKLLYKTIEYNKKNELNEVLNEYYNYPIWETFQDFQVLWEKTINFLKNNNLINNHVELFKSIKYQNNNLLENIINELTELNNNLLKLISNLNNDSLIFKIFTKLLNNNQINSIHQDYAFLAKYKTYFNYDILVDFIFKLITNKEL